MIPQCTKQHTVKVYAPIYEHSGMIGMISLPLSQSQEMFEKDVAEAQS